MKGNEEFVRDFFNSFGSVFIVGSYMQRLGFNVTVPVPEVRPNESERMKFMDDGDLLVTMPVQIKHRSLNFTCREDYPYKTIFIDEAYKVKPDTFMYVVVSKDKKHAAIIGRETRRFWVTEKIYDKHQKRDCENLACPKEHSKFIKFA